MSYLRLINRVRAEDREGLTRTRQAVGEEHNGVTREQVGLDLLPDRQVNLIVIGKR